MNIVYLASNMEKCREILAAVVMDGLDQIAATLRESVIQDVMDVMGPATPNVSTA